MNVHDIQAFGEASGIYAFMNTEWGWPTIEIVHYLALTTLLATVGVFDLRMLGWLKGVSLSALHRLVPLGVAAFVVSIASGALFFVSAPDQYAYNPAFQLKLLCMAVAAINVGVFYATLSHQVKLLTVDAAIPIPARIVAGVSLACWVGVIVFGRLITYFRPPYHWCVWC